MLSRSASVAVLAASPRRMERYAQASFAGTMAEYVHTLWHEVAINAGRDYLPYPGYTVDLHYFYDGFQQRGMQGRACSVTVAAAGYVATRNALTHRSELGGK